MDSSGVHMQQSKRANSNFNERMHLKNYNTNSSNKIDRDKKEKEEN